MKALIYITTKKGLVPEKIVISYRGKGKKREVITKIPGQGIYSKVVLAIENAGQIFGLSSHKRQLKLCRHNIQSKTLLSSALSIE